MDHTIALIEKSHNGDKEAREQLVEENIGLIWCVVKRFYGRGIEAEDLFQIGSIGLIKAIDKFAILVASAISGFSGYFLLKLLAKKKISVSDYKENI
jgi:DNA-directed RNA polymerase specialized sigma subunit